MMDRKIAPKISRIVDFSIVEPERTRLSNGIPLYVLRTGEQDVVRLDLVIRGGQWNQTLPLQAMFTNRMIREGSRKYSSSEIAERLDFYGSWLDLSSSINYGFVTLYSLSKYLPKTIEVLASMIKEPTFPEKELEVVVGANKQQYLINSERVDVMARKRFNLAMFGASHPLGRAVESEDYEKIDSSALREFHERHYHSNGCSIYVSGRITPEIIRCIDESFGQEEWGDTSRVTIDEVHKPQTEVQKRIFLEKDSALQSSVKMGCFTISQNHPDFMKLKVLVTLYGGYFGSRLMTNIREEKGYTYGIGAGLVTYPGISVFGISTETANEYVEPLIGEVYSEMERLQEELVSQEELDMVKSYMTGDLCRAYETAFTLPEAWIFLQTAGLPSDFHKRNAEAIRDVTAEEIRQLAQHYFCKERLIEVVAGKKV